MEKTQKKGEEEETCDSKFLFALFLNCMWRPSNEVNIGTRKWIEKEWRKSYSVCKGNRESKSSLGLCVCAFDSFLRVCVTKEEEEIRHHSRQKVETKKLTCIQEKGKRRREGRRLFLHPFKAVDLVSSREKEAKNHFMGMRRTDRRRRQRRKSRSAFRRKGERGGKKTSFEKSSLFADWWRPDRKPLLVPPRPTIAATVRRVCIWALVF